MSNSLAIAAVTTALRNLLVAGFADVTDMGLIKFTTQPPDAARTNVNENQLNIFLYQVGLNSAWRNNPEIPGKVRPGESAQPPLALDLHYLLTAYGFGDDSPDPASHRLLGRAMSVLHDHPVLSADELQTALADSEAHEQIERIRITHQPLGLEELSRLWSSFQTHCRPSVAYQVSVVLIESTRTRRTPLPVLTVGPGDRGVGVQADLTPPLPTIQSLVLPARKLAAEPGHVLTLSGFHLSGDLVEVRFTHPRISTPLVRNPEAGSTSTKLLVKVPDVADDPNAPRNWPPGFYRLTVAVTNAADVRVSNEQAFALAPRLESRLPVSQPAGSYTQTVDCLPQVRPEQSVVLMFGDRVVAPQAPALPASPSDPSHLSFDVAGATAGVYTLRLRVDGIDSDPVIYSGTPPLPSFDAEQQVTIT